MIQRPDFPIKDVSNAAELDDCARAWMRHDAIALDTEFVRERTYFPRPGLIQVSDGSTCWLVDPVAIDDLAPLFRLLESPGVVKVMHSPGQDLELLRHLGSPPPESLFDTQAAATFCGLGDGPGYAALVNDVLSARVDKGETRSDWTRRPLSDAQKHYAAQDVEFLIPLYRLLDERLKSLERETWHAEECSRLVAIAWSDDPTPGLQRQKQAWRLAPEEQETLARLWAWRERWARRLDRPRARVLQDRELYELVESPPRNARDLANGGRPPGWIRRFGDSLLTELDEMRNQPEGSRTARFPAPPRERNEKARLSALQNALGKLASDTGLPGGVLATRQTLNELATGESAIASPPGELLGWRRSVVVPMLAEALERVAE